LHEQEHKFEVAFKAIKEANKADNSGAIGVLQKLAVKIQHCQMLTQAIKARYDSDICEATYKKTLINLGGCLKKDPSNLGDAPLLVAGARMELELARLNQFVTTEAVNALNQSTAHKEPISMTTENGSLTIDFSKANDSLITKLKDETNVILTEAHTDTALKIKTLIGVAQNEDEKELFEKLKETRQSLFIGLAGEKQAFIFKSKGESAVSRIKTIMTDIENKSTNDSPYHTKFCSFQKISQYIAAKMKDIPHYIINDSQVYQEGVLVLDTATRKGTKSESLLSILESRFPNLIESATETSETAKIPKVSDLLRKVKIDSAENTELSIERVNTTIRLVATEKENINNRLKDQGQTETNKTEMKNELKKYNKLHDALGELKMNLTQIYESKIGVKEVKEIISKHKIDKPKAIAGVLDLNSQWTVHTLSKNESMFKNFKKMCLKDIDTEISKDKNQSVHAYIEKRFSNEIKNELLPAAKNAEIQKRTREYSAAWNDGPINSTNKDMVDKLARRVLNKLGMIGEKAGLRIDMPNDDAFQNILMTKLFLPMLDDFTKKHSSELVSGKLPKELKQNLSDIISKDFSEVMKAGNLTQFQDAHVDAIFAEIELKIAQSQLSGNSILPFVSGDLVGTDTSICNKVVMQRREIERAHAMEELKNYDLNEIISRELSAEDLAITDPRIEKMIREQGPEIMEKSIYTKFNTNQHTADQFSSNAEQAWNKQGLEQANQAAEIIEQNFDINAVSPEIKQGVIYRYAEKILKQGGLVDSLPAGEPAVSRISYLLNNEIAASSQEAVKQTTRHLNDIHHAGKDAQLGTKSQDSPKLSSYANLMGNLPTQGKSPLLDRIQGLRETRGRSNSNPAPRSTIDSNVVKPKVAPESLQVNATRQRSASAALTESTESKLLDTSKSKESKNATDDNQLHVKKSSAPRRWAVSPLASRKDKDKEKGQEKPTESGSPKISK
jgi:hypothetical protein